MKVLYHSQQYGLYADPSTGWALIVTPQLMTRYGWICLIERVGDMLLTELPVLYQDNSIRSKDGVLYHSSDEVTAMIVAHQLKQ